MTTMPHLARPETLPPDPTPPGRSNDEIRGERLEREINVDSVARARELLAVIKGLVERLEEHLDELG